MALLINGVAPYTREELLEEIEACRRTIECLMDRVENGAEGSGSAFALFQSNVALESTVKERTRELDDLNKKLTVAKEVAELNAKVRTEFLARMSHEIRTPMNGILGSVQLLQMGHLNSDQRALAVTIRRSGSILLELINDILDFSKMESGMHKVHKEPFDFEEAVADVCGGLAMLAYEKELYLIPDVSWGIPKKVFGDATALRHILVNLIGNAIKFTDYGEITVKAVAEKRHYKHGLSIQISDTGVGMSPEFVERAFDPFTQEEGVEVRRFGGTGLGLAIVHQLIQAMDGTIELESKLGEGTTFKIWIPMPLVQNATQVPIVENKDARKIAVVVGKEVERDYLTQRLNELNNLAVGIPPHEMDNDGVLELEKKYDYVFIDAFMYQRFRKMLPDFKGLIVFASINERITSEIPESANTLTKPTSMKGAMALFNDLESSGEELTLADDISEDATRERQRVLLVEDNETNRNIVEVFLDLYGYDIDFAHDGYEALTVTSHTSYPFILMDVQMPVMDGLTATQLIRKDEQENKKIPARIIGLTANATKEDERKCLEAGMNGYLSKPFNFDDLKRLLD